MSLGALALPAGGWASSGGVGPGSGGGSISPPLGGGSSRAIANHDGNATVSVSGDGVTLQTRASAMLRRGLSFSGSAPASLAGEQIEIQRSGHETHWRWRNTVTTTIASDGSFAVVWRTDHIGRFAIRAVITPAIAAQNGGPAVAQSDAATRAQGATTSPPLTVIVYRPSRATEFGPGFYGRRTACGERLHRATIGLANRTLKCGTKVAIYYRGRTLTVPVIDRGPYANGADWDLTVATDHALGIDGTAEIGAVSLPAR